MSQRISGYERQKNDFYETPEWVIRALVPHIPTRIKSVWEPANGHGAITRVLAESRAVKVSDLTTGIDFLRTKEEHECVITNPPYKLATEFINHSLRATKSSSGFVAMLLRTDFDHAKTRRGLFTDCEAFAAKLVLTRRIVWIANSSGSPSFNHAWFIWDWLHDGYPSLRYYVE